MTSYTFSFIFIFLFCSLSFGGDNQNQILVEPQGEEHLIVNGKNIYLEEISVRKIQERKKDYLLEIKVLGIHSWKENFLNASIFCKDKKLQIPLPETNLPTVWIYEKKLCSEGVKFCLTQENQMQACSRFLVPLTLEPLKDSYRVEIPKPFYLKKGEVLKMATANGRSMEIPWSDTLLLVNEKGEVPQPYKAPPRWYLAGLLDAVAVQSNTLFLGTGQLIYWPESSSIGDPRFTPQRLGGQFRYSNSLGSTTLASGQNITVNWADLSVNYRFEPTNIFDRSHTYAVMMTSDYIALGKTVMRMGGGFGYSFVLPQGFFGLNNSGKLFSYLDALLLPLDLSGDNRGMIFSSRISGTWLFESHWFVTSDVEARFLNFSLYSEQSVFRFQLGGGYSF